MTVETRYLRNALYENKQFPTAYNIITGSLSSGSLTNLQASDNVYMVFNSAAVGYNQVVEVEFIGSISGHIPFLQVQFEAHASVAVTVEVAVYNYEKGAYETSPSTMYRSASIGTSDYTLYLYNLLGNKKYRSATGEWKVKVKATKTGTASAPASAFSLYIDYLHFRSVAFQLGTTQTTTAAGNDSDVSGLTVGIRVWRVNADESETEITAGSPVATVTGADTTTTLSATWACPETPNVVAVIIIVYRGTYYMQTADPAAGGLPLVFITEDLNATLQASTWTVYYAFWYSAITDETYFRFGTTTYNSRIENFTWTVPPVLVETITAKNFPMLYLSKPITAQELISKVEGATITHIAKDYPEHLIKKGKAQELKSKFS